MNQSLTSQSVLVNARALIADPSRWTQGYAAVNQFGVETEPCDLSAVRWCAVGALARCAFGDSSDVFNSACDALDGACIEAHRVDIPRVNDEWGHAAILAAFDAAISGGAL